MLCSGILLHDVPACGACFGPHLLGTDGVLDTRLLGTDRFHSGLPSPNRYSTDCFGSNRFSANHGGPGLFRGSDC